MKNVFSLLILFLLVQCSVLRGQVVQYPVTANLQLNPPNSIYLTDYTSPGANKMRINLFQNDFMQPELGVRLKLTIEGNGISLQTNPNYNPPILNLRPGLNVLTAMDLEGYLNPINMLITGIEREALLANGSGLPEGMYRFCVQVFSHRDKNLDLSLPGCYNAMLQKNYAPIPILPACASVVPAQPGAPNFLMQWQSNANPGLMTEYLLKMAVVPPGINPNDAINGSQTPILNDIRVTGTTFNYGPTQPELDLGKTYVYRIKAQDPMGNVKYENDGLSQICTFQYGFGPAGVLNLTNPENLFNATASTPANFSWQRPSQVVPAQKVYYKIKVAEINSGQSDEDALKNNTALFEQTTAVTPANGNISLPENKYPLPIGKVYAWQVTAFSDAAGTAVEIAKSEIRKIKSAPGIPNFVAGSPFEMNIVVTDLSDNQERGNDRLVTGKGKIKVNAAGEERSISFTNALLEPNGSGGWKLKEGEITSDIEALVIDIDNSGEGQTKLS